MSSHFSIHILYYLVVVNGAQMSGRGCSNGVMVKELDCGFEVSVFKLQLCYWVPFQTNTLRKSTEPSYPSPKLCIK